MRQVLQSETVITTIRKEISTRCDRTLLQSVSGITKCHNYYKVRRKRSVS